MNVLASCNINIPTPLCAIMEKHGSDKGQATDGGGRNWHNYTRMYHAVFQSIRDQPLRIFELGLGTNHTDTLSNMGVHGRPGASLRGWKEYFPQSNVFGADIDRRILFQERGISTFFCDQTNPKIIETMWQHPDLQEPFDILIDDGLHEFEANKTFFEHSFHRVRPGGLYVIEDVLLSTLHKYEQQIQEWKTQFPALFARVVILPFPRNPYDNCLILIQRTRTAS